MKRTLSGKNTNSDLTVYKINKSLMEQACIKYKESKEVGANSFTLIKLLQDPIDNHLESVPLDIPSLLANSICLFSN